MKLHAISIAIVLAGMTGVSAAANPAGLMQPVVVSGTRSVNCTPPNGNTGHACDAFDGLLRAHFTARELGMLFGNRTSYPGYQSGDLNRLQKRYNALVQQYVAAHAQTTGTSVASVK